MEIHTLVTDIYAQVKKRGWMTDEDTEEFGRNVARRIRTQFEERGPPKLRLSQMGPRCPCALWNSIHHPELAEALPATAEIKYTFGHLIEAEAIMMARAAGHTVTGEQDELVVDGVKGHRDCVIDGCVVDVKSTSSLSFNKFQDGTLKDNDDFGYLDQLDGYLVGSVDDPLVSVKDRAYILAVDKQLGKLALYEHRVRTESIRARIAEYKTIVGRSEPPDCNCKSVPDGESGNLKLDVKGSYSPYKFCCKPTLRTAIYSGGPRYFTKVVKWPMYKGQPLKEVDRNGRTVYH